MGVEPALDTGNESVSPEYDIDAPPGEDSVSRGEAPHDNIVDVGNPDWSSGRDRKGVPAIEDKRAASPSAGVLPPTRVGAKPRTEFRGLLWKSWSDRLVLGHITLA